ncbi:DUF2235 domain-containing protein [Flammeovirgaceae bacterium SG7u.111]|nr:DUF2235 domain-containing protein [Flammeovirgaceae bacterium SG7u.132]WPO33028.1 DUF2235 domain-containing protein [Flammeovirgaceae bacterium SG7u.111]
MGKNIVVCYDGTGNEYGKNNTNVVKTFESIIRDKEQIGFYDPGVGTFSVLGRNLGKKVGIILGQAFGSGLQQNIEDGYEYLMNRYEPGDKLYIFGFSRGAFTARALAGMLHKFGLLQKGSKNLIPYVSKMYNEKRFGVANDFKKGFCNECKPHFVGVWDTVGSLGSIHSKTFYDAKLNPDVTYGYHAISIDEKRSKFPVSLWDELAREQAYQTIEQAWFAGVHSDVGGWYTETGLSDIALGWMMDKAQAAGLKLKDGWEKKLKQDCHCKSHESREGFWKVWKAVMRQIPENSLIHKSVVDRMNKNPAYRPILPANFEVVSNPTYDNIQAPGV